MARIEVPDDLLDKLISHGKRLKLGFPTRTAAVHDAIRKRIEEFERS